MFIRVDVKATEESEELTFEALIEDWKSFHYLQLELSTKQMYDRRRPHLNFLNKIPVEKINTLMVDELVKYWVKEHPKFHQRQSFEKELNLLKVILNYYRKRKNAAYVIPVLDEHYRAADVARKPERPVQSLSTEELGAFLDFLKQGINPNYYVLALAQFSFGLQDRRSVRVGLEQFGFSKSCRGHRSGSDLAPYDLGAFHQEASQEQ